LEAGEGIDRSLRAITHKAMAVRREDRYASVAALAKDIRDHLAGLAVSAHRESTREWALRLYRRHRRPVLAAAAVAVVALAGIAAWWANGEIRLAAAIANHRAMAAGHATRDDIASLEQARHRLGLLLELAPGDKAAAAAQDEIDRRLAAARDIQQVAAMRAQRRRDALALLDAAAPRMTSEDVAELDAASKRVLQAIGLIQDDADAAELHARCDAAYQALVTRRVQIEERARIARESAAELEAARRQRAEADARLAALDDDLAAGDLVRAATRLAEARTIDERHPRLVECERRIADAEAERLRIDAAAHAARRKRDCLARLDEARVALAEAERLGRVREAAARRVAALTVRLLQHGEVAVRAELAEAESARDDAARAREQALGRGYDLLHDAERAMPGQREVCSTLAAFFLARADEADALGDSATAASQLAQARAWATTAGDGSFSLDATVAVPAGAPAVTLARITTSSERIDIAGADGLRLGPGAQATVAKGRWLVRSDAGAIAAVRLERGRTAAIALTPPAALPEGTVWVPAGRVWDEHGRLAVDADGDEIVVAAFAVMIHEVTCGQYLEFLNDRATMAAYEKAYQGGVLRLCPRSGLRDESLWRKNGAPGSSAGQFLLATNERDSKPIDPLLPVSGVSCEDALAFAAWRAARDGIAWRLPTRLEWQLAAQGGDGRAYPWGDRADLTRCYSLVVGGGEASPQRLDAIARAAGGFPADRSVQGAFDFAGSLSEFVIDDESDPRWASLMGGNFKTRDPDRFATWSRRWVDPRHADLAHGFRLVARVE
ncbi:MAG TPA: SUMF1/EgtB/PvdO family nonheme iron enzyme, partial [Planctomycetota bacterium]|nr:SUMF1/EgtB/PvdO family nonheme iron enzyme [Planctomycetota bacterium]